MLIRLVYASTAQSGVDLNEFKRILLQAQANNHRRDLTGMLAFNSKIFLQALEGSRDQVNELYAKLIRDPRHHTVTVLGYKERGLMKITEPVLWARAVIADVWEVQASGAVDIITGASPQLVSNQSGRPVQTITGASISDRRTTADAKVTRRIGDLTHILRKRRIAVSDGNASWPVRAKRPEKQRDSHRPESTEHDISGANERVVRTLRWNRERDDVHGQRRAAHADARVATHA